MGAAPAAVDSNPRLRGVGTSEEGPGRSVQRLRGDQEVRPAEAAEPAPSCPRPSPDLHQQWAGMSRLARPELGAVVPGLAGTAVPTHQPARPERKGL